MEEIKRQVAIFKGCLSENASAIFKDANAGLTHDQLIAVYQEVNKDLRMKEIHKQKTNGYSKANADLATDKQKALMDKLNISYTDMTTKAEAHKFIADVLEKSK